MSFRVFSSSFFWVGTRKGIFFGAKTSARSNLDAVEIWDFSVYPNFKILVFVPSTCFWDNEGGFFWKFSFFILQGSDNPKRLFYSRDNSTYQQVPQLSFFSGVKCTFLRLTYFLQKYWRLCRIYEFLRDEFWNIFSYLSKIKSVSGLFCKIQVRLFHHFYTLWKKSYYYHLYYYSTDAI